MSSGLLGREPQVLDVENAHMKELLEAGARNIAQGQSCGVVDPKLNPESLLPCCPKSLLPC